MSKTLFLLYLDYYFSLLLKILVIILHFKSNYLIKMVNYFCNLLELDFPFWLWSARLGIWFEILIFIFRPICSWIIVFNVTFFRLMYRSVAVFYLFAVLHHLIQISYTLILSANFGIRINIQLMILSIIINFVLFHLFNLFL